MKAVKGKFSKAPMEGAQAPSVSRAAPMGQGSAGGSKVPMCDDPGETMWSPVANHGPSGNTKIDPMEEPAPTTYGAGTAKPSGSSGLKVPMGEIARGKGGTASDADDLNTVAAKKRPLKKGASPY